MATFYFLLVDRLGSMDENPKYWFNLKTGMVEQGYKSLALDRVGPFETAAEAAKALEIIAARAQAIKDEDED